MILSKLGAKINESLKTFFRDPLKNEETFLIMLKNITLAILESDVNVKEAYQFNDSVKSTFQQFTGSPEKSKEIVLNAVEKELVQMINPQQKPFIPKMGYTNVILVTGLKGVGKTTTCSKLAKYYSKKGWRTAQVMTDTFRVGAFDSLAHNRKHFVPYYGSYTESDPLIIAEEGVKYFKKENFEVVIVDTSGRYNQFRDLFDEMKLMIDVIYPDECILVIDSSQGQNCQDQALAFKNTVEMGSVILTKLDNNSKAFGALNAVVNAQIPISFVSTGEFIEDLHLYNAETIVSDMIGFNLKLEIPSSPLIQGRSREYSLRDLQLQYQNVLKVGGLNAIKYLPSITIDIQNEKEAIKKIQKYLVILDSMNEYELDYAKLFDESRKIRIAKGSGCDVTDIDELLKEFSHIKKMFNNRINQTPQASTQISKISTLSKYLKDISIEQVNKIFSQFSPAKIQQMKCVAQSPEFQNLLKNVNLKQGKLTKPSSQSQSKKKL